MNVKVTLGKHKHDSSFYMEIKEFCDCKLNCESQISSNYIPLFPSQLDELIEKLQLVKKEQTTEVLDLK